MKILGIKERIVSIPNKKSLLTRNVWEGFSYQRRIILGILLSHALKKSFDLFS
jgi:hypothetical protein